MPAGGRVAARPDLRRMEKGIRIFLEAARGGPLTGDLRLTPGRVARAWRDDLLAGYRGDPAKILVPLNAERGRDLVVVKGIDFVSTCSHHLLPFHGKVHIAYLPDGRITGISRLAKLVRCLSRRLQIQEDLTRDLVESLQRCLAPRGAACLIEAVHLCMAARGEQAGSGTVVTTAFSGCFGVDARERGAVLSLLAPPFQDRGIKAGGGSRRADTRRPARRRSPR